ncbi:MAG: 4Fe-4S dicluster domain-containing protein [Desulfofustis sp.]|nr:4Fe-4S dicluster domain-containing protein [Desulfofustis sp.]
MLACTAAHYPGQQGVKLSRIHIADSWPEMPAIHVCVPCKEQACIAACPDQALSWDGHVVLDVYRCSQCGACVEACPFSGVRIHPVSGMPMICDTCGGAFPCVAVCPTRAISRS